VTRTVSATNARIRLGELMRWAVESHRPVVVERGGKPYVVMLSVREYERLKVAQDNSQDWRELVELSREQIRGDLGGRELIPPEDVLRRGREERDAQLADLR
jgi:prevent-host-death family protein